MNENEFVTIILILLFVVLISLSVIYTQLITMIKIIRLQLEVLKEIQDQFTVKKDYNKPRYQGLIDMKISEIHRNNRNKGIMYPPPPPRPK